MTAGDHALLALRVAGTRLPASMGDAAVAAAFVRESFEEMLRLAERCNVYTEVSGETWEVRNDFWPEIVGTGVTKGLAWRNFMGKVDTFFSKEDARG